MVSFSERFAIRRLVGEGGMGAVYEGSDSETGETVALKVFRSAVVPASARVDASGQEQRFEREAELLRSCDDAGIVRYVAHGTTAAGELFLAMEWLEGVDLATRLEKGALTPEEALAVTIRAASALQHAHERGIVHRDVKPSNVFLVEGDPLRVKLIDFGVARAKSKRALTRTNVFLGTVGYMAPEQVMGLPDVDARADVFSLGCVLYECLTGIPAYASDEPLAVFAKLLVDEPPRLSAVKPELPDSFDAVLGRMLARQRDQRYTTMAQALADLRAIAAGESVAVVLPTVVTSELGERRVVSFIAVDNGYVSSGDRTVTPDQASGATGEMLAVAKSLGVGKVVELDGLIVFGTWEGGARDRAVRAVACSMAIAESFPQASVGVATGASDTFAHSTDGDVIRRALRLSRGSRGGHGVAVDEPTADLVSEVFTLAEERGVLRALRMAKTEDRTPLVGRQRELAYLETSLSEVAEERVARAVVVVGAEGSGKTRLLRAFVERDAGSCVVLRAAGTSATATEPFSLLRQLIQEADALPAASVPRGGKPPASEQSVLSAIRTSTGEPPVPEAVARAVAGWLRRFAQRGRPIVLIVEDAQWADSPSLSALGSAVRTLEGAPVFLVATTRPAGRVVSGGLLSWAHTTELRLQPLSSRASEALLRSLLSRDVGDEVLERMVASADGNAFSLGMLARYVNRTGNTVLPDTVLALVVARLESLKDDERSVVRAASLFGRSFPADAVAGVLRKELATIERVLAGLAAEDLFTEAASGIYRFRHESYARAAYEMIGSASRMELHRQAAEVLIQRRAAPLTIAHQFRFAGMNDEAAEWYVRVAQDTAHRLTGSRERDELEREEDGEVEMSRAHAAIMHCHDDRLGVEWLLRGFARAKIGSRSWWRGVPLSVAIQQAGPAVAEVARDALRRVATARLPESRDFIRDLPDIVWWFGSLGLGRVARHILQRVRAELAPRPQEEPLIELSFALLDYHGPGLVAHTERRLEAATRAAMEVGEHASALNGRLYLGLVQGCAGRVEEGIATLSDVIEFDEHSMITRSAKTCRAMLYGVAGRTQEAFRDLEAADGDSFLAIFQNIQRCIILQGAGRNEQAMAIARSVYEAFAAVPSVRIAAGVSLAELLLEQSDFEGALALAEDGLGVLADGEIGFGGFHHRFLAIRAHALTALEHPAAAEATRLALDRVTAELEAQPGEDAREAFRNLPLVSWVLANAIPRPRRYGPRDTLPQMRSPVGHARER